MKKEKIFALCMTLFFIFYLNGCGGGGGGDSDNTDNPNEPSKPATPWLCFTAEEAGSSVSTMTVESGVVSSTAPTLEYSIDGGVSWNNFRLTYYGLISTEWVVITPGTTVPLANGEKVYIRAKDTNATFSVIDGFNYRTIKFKLTGIIAASGNVMSLLDKECSSTTIPCDYCFNGLFQNCTALITAPELPAKTLKNNCYYLMFDECTNLLTAPKLPATTLTVGCYCSMFEDCRALTSGPELPATTLTTDCYRSMFYGCTNLLTAPKLPAKTLPDYCYSNMFYNCHSLSKITVCFESWASGTSSWVTNVSTSGIFTCPEGLTESYGQSAIPTGWTVHKLPAE